MLRLASQAPSCRSTQASPPASATCPPAIEAASLSGFRHQELQDPSIATGELGNSFNYEMPVSTLYFQRLPNSLQLAAAATLLSFLIGIPAGLISGVRVNTGDRKSVV